MDGQGWPADLQRQAHWRDAFGEAIREFRPAHRVASHAGRWQLGRLCLERRTGASRKKPPQGNGSTDAGARVGQLASDRGRQAPARRLYFRRAVWRQRSDRDPGQPARQTQHVAGAALQGKGRVERL